MAKKQIDNLSQMQNELKHAIREYYLTDNKESILTIQELSTKMAVLHGFESTVMADADSYAVRLDEHCKKMAMTYSYKYMLLRTFAIPTGEDPDKISSAETDEKIKKIDL